MSLPSPQVSSAPAVSWVKVTPSGATTGTGSNWFSKPPPLPQQYAWLSLLSPQVWEAPPVSWMNETPGGAFTATGIDRSSVLPSPSSPFQLPPQQYARVSLPIPHVWVPPAVSWVKVTPNGGLTCTRPGRSALRPSPSWPRMPFPQQYAWVSLPSPHVCCMPVVSWVKATPSGALTGNGARIGWNMNVPAPN
ncbi:hypothetical protein OHA21_17180 [Actinoplanes sp. NBC_00393]